jgi:hypothetical protein
MRWAALFVMLLGCKGAATASAPTMTSATARPTAIPASTAIKNRAPAAPTGANAVCATAEALVQARYEPLCLTLCTSNPDCNGKGPCQDGTDTEGHAIRVCEQTGYPPNARKKE